MHAVIALMALIALTVAGCPDVIAPIITPDATGDGAGLEVQGDGVVTPDGIGADGEDGRNEDGQDDAIGDQGDDQGGDAVGPDGADGEEDTEIPDEDVPLGPCDPPLGFDEPEYFALPNSFSTLNAIGGGGDYRFSLLTSEDGAIMHPTSGAYLSGPTIGVTNTVEVTDLTCIGSAQVDVSTIDGVTITPAAPTVPPGTAISFQGGGGSGTYNFNFANNSSGASMTLDGTYTAGIGGGIDTIVMTDASGSTSTAYATVNVVPGITPSGYADIIYIATGQTQSLNIVDGSGSYSFVSDNPGVVGLGPVNPASGNPNETLVAQSPGSATITATDVFTGLTTTMQVRVVEGVVGPTELSGDGSDRGDFDFADVDGDGIVDAVFGRHEADVEAWDGGAAYVYKGTSSGFEAEPMQVMGWPGRQAYFGRSVTLADLDGDGSVDLLVGAERADLNGRTDCGGAMIYRGIQGAGFETEPAWTSAGNHNSDYLGYSVATCDFNGDGRLDIVVGAPRDEDRDLDPVPSDQGAVWLYLGTDSGFPEAPDQVIYGETPSEDGTAMAPTPGMYFGTNLAVGDHDGDGVCDLAVSGERYATPDAPGSRNNDGAVLVYRGVQALGPALGGLEPLPIRAIRGSDEGPAASRLGRNLSMGDVTGDGTDDLLLGQYNHDIEGGSANGAARLFLGDGFALPAVAAWEAPGDNDWSFEGDNNTDYYGWDVAIADVDGIPPLDVVSANPIGETVGGQGNAGFVAVFYGVQDGLPDPLPALELSNQQSGTPRFGAAVGVAPDMDGDGVSDFLVLAGRDDTLAYEGGALYFVPATVATDPTAVTLLNTPAQASGSRFGWGTAVVGDVTGNGHPDLVVGAPTGDTPGEGLNSGRVFLYEGQPGGFSETATLELNTFNAYSSGDQWGLKVTGLGRFDGDDVDDFAVVGYSDDLPNNIANTYTIDGTCPDSSVSNTGSTAVFSGSATLSEDEPAFIIYGLEQSQYTEAVAGRFDINGDGRNDLAFSTRYADGGGENNSGGMAVVFGRDRTDPAGTTAICEPDYVLKGFELNSYLGVDVTPLGDVNGDGCDELAIGGYSFDWPEVNGSNNKGGVYILFGWGLNCTFQEARFIAMQPGTGTGVQAGYSVAGGYPVDSLDDIPDLVVGGISYAGPDGGNGGVALISGAYIAQLASAAEPLADGVGPSAVYLFQSDLSTANILGTVTGTGGQLGRAVALIPNAMPDGRAAVLAGAPLSDLGGIAQSGGAAVFVGSADGGLQATPTAIFGGEGARPGGRVGERVSAGVLADGTPVLVVGGYLGTSFSLDQGSVYAFPWVPAVD